MSGAQRPAGSVARTQGHPRATVVVPVHNVEPYLRHCVDSLLAGDLEGIEVILVDDGSTDGSGAVCDAYAAEDPRVEVVHQTNAGLSAARNAGLSLATGDYVAFIDGDDWVEPGAFASLQWAAEQDQADVVVAGFHVDTVNAAGKLLQTGRIAPALEVTGPGLGCAQASPALIGMLGYAWNKLYRRRLIIENGLEFPPGVSLIEDASFNGQALRLAERVLLLDEAHVHYVQRPRQTLGNRYYDDFVNLRSSAIAATIDVLTAWGMSSQTTKGLSDLLRLEAIYRGLQLAVASDTDARVAHDRVRKLLRDPAVRQTLAEGWRGGSVPTGHRAFAAILLASPARLVTQAFRLQQRRRRDGGSQDR